MNDKEKDIIRKISLVISNLDKEKQNYILGVAEGMVFVREEQENKQSYESKQQTA